MRKTIIFALILSAVMLISPGCRRTSHNGDIDGYWRILTIEYVDDAGNVTQTVTPDDYFYAVNLELFQLCKRSKSPGEPVVTFATGVMTYSNDGDTLGLDFPLTDSSALLAEFGIMSNPAVLKIKKLDCEHLVMQSDNAIISCSKF